ncbi:MAG TPA: DUF1326 domain-containing protein [Candidatus Kapabacteria bacterium]|nr:DUF1326 domain-containing protein [Candidatus Kapabacteria bacterium]
METEYIQSCNCDYGCACNFNGRPDKGNCEALIAHHIRKGFFGNTKLDGATFAIGLWWPKAIHEGGGTVALYIDEKVTPEQQTAIEEITGGKQGGGVFEIFPMTFASAHPVKRMKIDFHYDDYDSWFKVAGVGEVISEHIKNPVTNDNFEGSISLPGGIAFKNAIVSSIKSLVVKDGDLNFSHKNTNGHVTVAKFSNAGCIG